MKKPRLLITRPPSDAKPLKLVLEQQGYKVSIAPVIKIHAIKNIDRKIHKILDPLPQAIISTSKNTLRILHINHATKNIPLIVIGDASATLAKQLGFHKVKKAGSNAQELAEYIRTHFHPHNGTILYPAAKDISIDLPHVLKKLGFEVKKLVTYQATAIKKFKKLPLQQLQKKHVDGILFFSQRSAKIFLQLYTNAKLHHNSRKVAVFCLSKKISAVFPSQYFRKYASPYPSEKELIKLIKKKLKLTRN